jgi:HEAT repeat protein
VSPAASPSRREVATAGHTGSEATARAGLVADDPAVRATALGALARLGVLDEATLAVGLDDGSPIVRRRAAELAATRPTLSLVGLLRDPDDSVAEMAAWAVAEQHEERETPDDVVGALVELATGHRDPLVRESAVAALGAIGDERGLAAILAATHDKPAIRRRAVIALTPFDGPEVDEALERAKHDRDWQVRDAADDLA